MEEVTLSNTHIDAWIVTKYTSPAGSENGTSFLLWGIVCDIQKSYNLQFFTLLQDKKVYFNVVFKLIYFKHGGNILRGKHIS